MQIDKNDIYTSTGVKFWRHRSQMESYKKGQGRSIISTHVSPEGSCNLRCKYCSVWDRDKSFRISLNVMKDYILKLKSRGLLAVIITGGGEPLLYPEINELVSWLTYDMKLVVGLITNGTVSDRLDVWELLSWVRISINRFPGWKDIVQVPRERMRKDTILGTSFIYTGEDLKEMKEVAAFVEGLGVAYVRIVPNCLIKGRVLDETHRKIDYVLGQLKDERFFHQYKIHQLPRAGICHQSYFRPYLSEIDGGTVYPCDSVVLNEGRGSFLDKYRVCKAEEVLDFLDKKVELHFNVQKDCLGCVFTRTVNMLDDWVCNKRDEFDKFACPIYHEEFV